MPRYGRKLAKYIADTATGTQNAWAPGLRSGVVNFVSWAGASSMTLNGIAGAGMAPGTIVVIKNYGGTSNWSLSNMNAGAASGDKIFTACAALMSVGTTRGTASFVYDGTIWQLLEHDMATGFEAGFVAGHYVASAAGTWTVESGDVQNLYCFVHRRIYVILSIEGTTVAQSGGDPTILRVTTGAFGNGGTNSTTATFPFRYSDNGVIGTGYATIASSGTNLDFRKLNNAQWATATNTTSIWASFSLELI